MPTALIAAGLGPAVRPNAMYQQCFPEGTSGVDLAWSAPPYPFRPVCRITAQ
jgi:hypothetical protein